MASAHDKEMKLGSGEEACALNFLAAPSFHLPGREGKEEMESGKDFRLNFIKKWVKSRGG